MFRIGRSPHSWLVPDNECPHKPDVCNVHHIYLLVFCLAADPAAAAGYY